jgi:hypothetical protein
MRLCWPIQQLERIATPAGANKHWLGLGPDPHTKQTAETDTAERVVVFL